MRYEMARSSEARMDEDLRDPRVDAALKRLVASEVGRASREVRARKAGAADAATRRRFKVPLVAFRGLVIGAAIVAAISGGFMVVSLRSSLNSPDRGPDIGARYADGIPMELNGQKVLRGDAAVQAARESVDSTPFLVGVWASYHAPISCPALSGAMDFPCPSPILGDMPGFLDEHLRSFLSYYQFGRPGAVVIRVHTHDAEADSCAPENRDMCMHVMVPEAVLWRGDGATNPKPISIAQAAAAFGVAATPSEAGLEACAGMYLPGVTVLKFPDGDRPMQGIVAIFPSPQAAQRFAPAAAAAGESDTLPAGVTVDCGDHISQVRWFVRGNVVVAVQYYYAGGGADTEPAIQFAREALGRLPD
jgi:hypothetical protein